MPDHKIAELVCLKCLKRWMCVRPKDVPLKIIECPGCGERGYVIETGEIENKDATEVE